MKCASKLCAICWVRIGELVAKKGRSYLVITLAV